MLVSNVSFTKGSNSEIDNVGVAQKNKMGFADIDSSVLIRMLTETYAHPLEAAIRETASNAIDACVRAGISVADGVHIGLFKEENAERVYIEVSDNGSGMDYDALLNRFLSYAASDKSDDANAIGAFGLGAKAPLAYTDSFDVWTKTAGASCLYANPHRDADGGASTSVPVEYDDADIPLVNHSSGTVIRFDVDSDDVDKARSILYGISAILKFCDDAGAVVTMFDDNGKQQNAFDHMFNNDVNAYALRKNTRGFIELTSDSIVGKDGDPVDFKVYGSYSDPNFTDDSQRSIKDLAFLFMNYKHNGYFTRIGDKNHLLSSKVAFKVGCWLYPANGSEFYLQSTLNNSDVYSLDMKDYAFIIEVPSRALSFTPSRDSIIVNDKSEAFLIAAFDAIEKFAHNADEVISKYACAPLYSNDATLGAVNALRNFDTPYSYDSSLFDFDQSSYHGRAARSLKSDNIVFAYYTRRYSRKTQVHEAKLNADKIDAGNGRTIADEAAELHGAIFRITLNPGKIAMSGALSAESSFNDIADVLAGLIDNENDYERDTKKTTADGIDTGNYISGNRRLAFAPAFAPTLAAAMFTSRRKTTSYRYYRSNSITAHGCEYIVLDGSSVGMKNARKAAINAVKEQYGNKHTGITDVFILPPVRRSDGSTNAATESEWRSVVDASTAFASACGYVNIKAYDADSVQELLTKKRSNIDAVESSCLDDAMLIEVCDGIPTLGRNWRSALLNGYGFDKNESILSSASSSDEIKKKLDSEGSWKKTAMLVIGKQATAFNGIKAKIFNDRKALSTVQACDTATVFAALGLIPKDIEYVLIVRKGNATINGIESLMKNGVEFVYSEDSRFNNLAEYPSGSIVATHDFEGNIYKNQQAEAYVKQNIPFIVDSSLVSDEAFDKIVLYSSHLNMNGISAFKTSFLPINALKLIADDINGDSDNEEIESDWRYDSLSRVHVRGTGIINNRISVNTRFEGYVTAWDKTLKEYGLMLTDDIDKDMMKSIESAIGVSKLLQAIDSGVPIEDLL